MATTSPDNLRTPNPGDPFNLVPDLATLANDVQNALNNKQSNVFKGTAAQRAAFLSTAIDGMLWQDTDGIKMIWRKDGANWVPAIWRWAGTTAQMNAFTQAPEGFEWFNTSDGLNYIRRSGAWSISTGMGTRVVKTSSTLTLPGGAYTDLGPGFVLDRAAPGISWTSNRFVATSAGRYALTGLVLITTPTGYLFTPSSTAVVTFPTSTYAFSSASSSAGEMGLSFNIEMDLTAGGSVYLSGLPGGGSSGTLRGSTSLMKSWFELRKVS